MTDTIAAISTALGVGAISIIRVSGDEAIKIVNKLFDKDLTKVASHTINYGHIMDKDEVIDEVLVSVMKSPKTYTGEDVVEINCHGGIATTNKILELLLRNGCLLAKPGEFTKRAFLNGKLDLIEANSVMDLINSKSEKSRALAINQLRGKVSSMIKDLRNEILDILANIEVNIDYPEYYDIEIVTISKIKEEIKKIDDKLSKILKESENGKIIKEGIKTVIVGKPNVGKSSLLNRLIEEDKAIVTDIEGTTRDIVEGSILIEGVILNIIDTAGIRNTTDKVEKIGVLKSLDLIDNCDLILLILNNNEVLTKEDMDLLAKIKDKNYLIIVNKTDLENKIDLSNLDQDKIVYMSLIKDEGIDKLKDKIKQIFNLEKIKTEDLTYLSSARSIAIIKECLDLTKDIKDGITNDFPIDMLEIDLKRIWELLGEIIGVSYEDELIDQLFSNFCLGK